MKAGFDFHLHTVYSYDASAPVEYYFEQARAHGVGSIAITEHHTMDSIDEIRRVAARYPEVRNIPAAELTVDASIGPVDLVCLGLPAEPPPELAALFEEYRAWQRAFGEATSRAMEKLGFPYPAEERQKLLASYRTPEAIARQGVTHVNNIVQLAEFIRRGWLKRGEEAAFRERLRAEVEFPRYPAAGRVLPEVRRCGALVFIAHPIHYFRRDDRRRMDALREELGFDGVECCHPMVPPELSLLYRAYCLEHRLLSSAGSDCHSDPPHYHLNVAPECRFAEHAGPDRFRREIEERLNA